MSDTTAEKVRVLGGAPLAGSLSVPGDKSISHRALLISAMAGGVSRLRGLSHGKDVAHTLAAVQALGASTSMEEGALSVTGSKDRLRPPREDVDCGNSGTGLRLLAGVAATLAGRTVLTGDGSLSARPMDRIAQPLEAMGARVHGRGERCLPPLHVTGAPLHGIDWRPVVASAQVKAAILLAGLRASGQTVVREAVPTRMHTEELLAVAGASITVEHDGADRVVTVRESTLVPIEIDVPGDPSQAAFWVVAACIIPGSEVVVRDVYVGSERIGFIPVLQRMGAAVASEAHLDRPGGMPTGDIVARFGPLQATTVDAAEIPSLDEVPILAVAAAVAEGTTVFRGMGELRVKESNRLDATAELVGRFGAVAEVVADDLVIHGLGPTGSLVGARFDCGGDHRMAMAAAIGGLAARNGRTVIAGFECVDTSYPGFLEVLAQLGGTGEVRGSSRSARGRAPSDDRMVGPVVAIDGPAGSGKSTVSRALAARLGLARLDTGAMYRSVTWAALDRGIDLSDGEALAAIAGGALIEVDGSTVRIDGVDVSDPIRSADVSRAVSQVAAMPDVRRHLVERQRRWIAAHHGGVVEGRDIGTVVFPDADLKVYLTASASERARRRSEESPDGIARRDRIDSTRLVSPLLAAADAIVVDTTDRTVDDVVDEVCSWL
ncbi:MAG: 3-phosphoshikimate 1-carboxyvinyltransferase [Acidimicrobiales bacterium]